MMNDIYCGDARQILKKLPTESVRMLQRWVNAKIYKAVPNFADYKGGI